MKRWMTHAFALAAVTAGALCGAAFAADKLNENDQAFLTKAAQGNMAEVRLGRLAAERAAGDRVKQFGRRMIQEHGKAQQELTALAQQNSWTLPTEVSEEQKKLYDTLAQHSGEAFDKAYMEQMVKDHEMDVALYERASVNTAHAGLKEYATRTLPTLKEHLKMAKEIAGVKDAEAEKAQ